MHALAPSAPADVRALLHSLGIALPVATGIGGAQRAPERVLGQALSLPETVRLADVPVRSDSEAPPALDRERLAKQAAQRLATLRQRVERSYAEAWTGKHALPDAGRLHAMMAEHAAGFGPTAAVRRAAGALAQGYAELFERTLSAMQREIDLFKEAMRAEVRRAGPPDSHLLVLDRLVDPVITRELRQAHRALARAYERSCAARIEAALSALVPDAGSDAVQALFARGALGDLFRDARRLILALLDLEWSMVQGLLDALCGAQDATVGS